MTLVKTSLLNGIAVIVKMLTLLGINKILAVYVGPSGYAALGQFQNAVQMITTFASGAINTGVTKYTAEYHQDEVRQRAVWRTAGKIALLGSVVTAILITIFHQSLASWFLKDPRFGGVFLSFAATLTLFTFNSLFLSILNGKKDIGRYVLANIGGSIFALFVTAILVTEFGLFGALVALSIYQSISFFITLALCYKAPWFNLRLFFGRIDKQVAIDLSKYSLMAFTSAACVPISHILIRNHLGASLGWEAAGFWEAIWRMSSAYLMFVTTTLSVYYLPRLSELNDTESLRVEILRGYRLILPIAATSAIVIYVLRDFIIALLFTRGFYPMRDLFAWQMLGDTLKIGSWILAYLMLGKAMFKPFIILEVLFSFAFFSFTWLFVRYFGLKGVAIAHAVNYALYWIVTARIVAGKLDCSILYKQKKT